MTSRRPSSGVLLNSGPKLTRISGPSGLASFAAKAGGENIDRHEQIIAASGPRWNNFSNPQREQPPRIGRIGRIGPIRGGRSSFISCKGCFCAAPNRLPPKRGRSGRRLDAAGLVVRLMVSLSRFGFYESNHCIVRQATSKGAAVTGMVHQWVTDSGGSGRRPEGDAPRSGADALGARRLVPARPQPPIYCRPPRDDFEPCAIFKSTARPFAIGRGSKPALFGAACAQFAP